MTKIVKQTQHSLENDHEVKHGLGAKVSLPLIQSDLEIRNTTTCLITMFDHFLLNYFPHHQ